jgi:hypothetical protein
MPSGLRRKAQHFESHLLDIADFLRHFVWLCRGPVLVEGFSVSRSGLDFSKLFSVGLAVGWHPDSCIAWVWRLGRGSCGQSFIVWLSDAACGASTLSRLICDHLDVDR